MSRVLIARNLLEALIEQHITAHGHTNAIARAAQLSLEARPAQAVQVPDEEAAFSAWADGKWPLAKKSHSLGAWSREHMRSARDGWMARAALAAAPSAPAPVATETVAQGGGVDDARTLLAEILAEADDFTRRTGKPVNGWPERARALLASAPAGTVDGVKVATHCAYCGGDEFIYAEKRGC